MYAKTMARIRSSCALMGTQRSLIEEVIKTARRPREVKSTSYLMNLHLLACVCDAVISHTRYLEENREILIHTPSETARRKFEHINASTLNYRAVLDYRARLVLDCLDDVPHTNPYSGERNEY